jgi:hypothetical protein
MFTCAKILIKVIIRTWVIAYIVYACFGIIFSALILTKSWINLFYGHNLLKALFSRIADYFEDNIFLVEKGHFATIERELFVSSENLGVGRCPLGPLAPPPPSPGSYAPGDDFICLFSYRCTVWHLPPPQAVFGQICGRFARVSPSVIREGPWLRLVTCLPYSGR